MKTHSYEIYQRESGDHREGHLGLLIDGQEGEITVQPGQFLEKALRIAQAEGKAPGPEAAQRAEEICQNIARRAIQRRIEKLQQGRLPDPIRLGLRGMEGGSMDAGTAGQLARPRGSEAQAVEAFLNRGKLRGLTKQERAERAKRRRDKHDCDADWRQRRAALIADREQQLAKWQAELAKGNHKAERWVIALKAELEGLTARVLCASHGFQYAYGQYLTKQVSLSADDIRIIPLMTNTTVDTQRDTMDHFNDFTTVDEADGSGYSAGGLALDNQAVNIDDANDRAEFDADDETVTSFGACTRSIQGVAMSSFVTNTAGSMVLHWIEFASNKTPDGSDFTFVFNTEGILQAADG